MRTLYARFAGVCAETGKRIAKGEECLYDPKGRQVYAIDSNTYRDWYSARFDEVWLGASY
jgi:hypothetical protein